MTIDPATVPAHAELRERLLARVEQYDEGWFGVETELMREAAAQIATLEREVHRYKTLANTRDDIARDAIEALKAGYESALAVMKAALADNTQMEMASALYATASRRAEAAESSASQLREALTAIVEFCDDPNGSEKPESLAMGLSRMLPAARAALKGESHGAE